MISTSEIPMGPTSFREPETDAFDKTAIAGLSAAQIVEMTNEELIDVIHGAELPPSALRQESLHYMNRPELERMAHLACRCCRLRGY